MDWRALALSAGLCIAMIVAEGALTGKDLHRWLVSLKRPRLFPPLWVWIMVAVLIYTIQGVIAYRLLLRPPSFVTGLALALLIAAMSANVAYNVVLDRTRRPRFAYVGVVWFLPLIFGLQIVLHLTDKVAAALGWIYFAWVVAYDVPIMRALWKLNADPQPTKLPATGTD